MFSPPHLTAMLVMLKVWHHCLPFLRYSRTLQVHHLHILRRLLRKIKALRHRRTLQGRITIRQSEIANSSTRIRLSTILSLRCVYPTLALVKVGLEGWEGGLLDKLSWPLSRGDPTRNSSGNKLVAMIVDLNYYTWVLAIGYFMLIISNFIG